MLETWPPPARKKAAPLFFGARVVLVGVALSVFQRLVGINTVSYGPEIFARLGYHMDGARHGGGLIVNLMSTMVAGAHRRQGGAQTPADRRRRDHGVSMALRVVPLAGPGMFGLAAICLPGGFAISFGPIV
jgi:small neutral amino acid transporter SnatA (MarC family)